jgi:hypothetical protein
MRNSVTIKYQTVYSQGLYIREKFVEKAQEDIFYQLTGRKVLDSVSRELIRDLTGGAVTFEEIKP